MRLVKSPFCREDGRGSFREMINSGCWRSINYGAMKKGALMGNHYHKRCEALFFLTSGSCDVISQKAEDGKLAGEPESAKIGAHEGAIFFPFETHVIRFTDDSSFLLLKTEPFDHKDQDIYPLPLE